MEFVSSMKTLRALHLYLGCFFAPMLVFFAISGIWQTFHWHYVKGQAQPHVLALLSTLHTNSSFKAGQPSTLSSPYLKWFVVAMSAGLLLSILLGVLMAFKHGRRGPALFCLAAGTLTPLALILLALHQQGVF